MSKIKNFLNKAKHLHVKDVTEKFAIHLEIEKKLIPRLKAIGLILLSFSACSLLYAYFTPSYNASSTDHFATPSDLEKVAGLSLDDPDSPPLELTPTERLNFYFVSFIFTAVGLTCVLISKKKKREHFPKDHDR
jgi:hypothetical protein